MSAVAVKQRPAAAPPLLVVPAALCGGTLSVEEEVYHALTPGDHATLQSGGGGYYRVVVDEVVARKEAGGGVLYRVGFDVELDEEVEQGVELRGDLISVGLHYNAPVESAIGVELEGAEQRRIRVRVGGEEFRVRLSKLVGYHGEQGDEEISCYSIFTIDGLAADNAGEDAVSYKPPRPSAEREF